MANPDLYNFMKQLQAELASEYKRIQRRVREDPGTAGDEGEENWATLLRNWLPPGYQIVTKGRIVGHDGLSSPQVDVLVLHPAYPRHLLHKKHYLAGGVVAAFECKLTLRAEHLMKAFETCAIVKNLVPKRTGTPYRELHQAILFENNRGQTTINADWTRNCGLSPIAAPISAASTLLLLLLVSRFE
jgi:hypothetical protein